jgi:hypothetical protein
MVIGARGSPVFVIPLEGAIGTAQILQRVRPITDDAQNRIQQ